MAPYIQVNRSGVARLLGVEPRPFIKIGFFHTSFGPVVTGKES